MALPPNRDEQIGKVMFRLLGLDGTQLAEFPGTIATFEKEGNFRRAKAEWPYDLAPAGAYQLLGIIYDKSGAELGRVAPRLMSANWVQGF